jgi:hypothetical protein
MAFTVLYRSFYGLQLRYKTVKITVIYYSVTVGCTVAILVAADVADAPKMVY